MTAQIKDIEQTTPVAVNVLPFDQSKLKLEDDPKATKNGYAATYNYTGTDNKVKTQVIVLISRDPNGYDQIGKTSFSIRLKTEFWDTDALGITTKMPIEAVLSVSVPGVGRMPESDQVLALVQNCFSLWFDGVDGSSDPNTGVIMELSYDRVKIFG
jgi:hypothetical protein